MKRIFGFLLVLLSVLYSSKVFATDYTVTGKVRYMIELKKLTKQQAQAALQTGYVDLWTYLLVDEGFVNNNPKFIEISNGNITSVKIRTGSNTHSFKLTQKDGVTLNRSIDVAQFAGAMESCSVKQKGGTDGLAERTFFNCCPTWYYGASVDPFSVRDRDIADFVKDTVIDGKKWFMIKQYTIRFAYKKAESFYASFYVEDGSANDPKVYVSNPHDDDCLHGSSNLNLYYESGSNKVFGTGVPNGQQDWSYYMQMPGGIGAGGSADMYGLIAGGVEVIARMEAEAPVEATCWGTDAPGKFTVTSWGGNSWGNYSTVTVTAKSATSSKKLTVGTDLVFGGAAICGASGAVTATGSPEPAEYPFTLKPSGYTLPDGSLADSLIWAIEGTFLA